MSHHDEHGDVVTDPEVEQVFEPTNGNGSVPGLTVLDRLKDVRTGVAEAHVLELEVAGTQGRLVLMLGPLPRQRFAQLQHRASQSTSPEAELNLNADTLIAACRQVLGRESRGEPLRPVHPDGEPVRIDDRLAQMLGLPADSRARDVLTAVYALAPSPDVAIGVAAGTYMQWASAANEQVDEEFEGESASAER